jgi:hypothetical protein
MDIELVKNILEIVVIFITFPEHTVLLLCFVIIAIVYSLWNMYRSQ